MKTPRERRRYAAPALEMTPMIDVVFQLLIFFIVVMKPIEKLSQLDIQRPAPIVQPAPPTVSMIRILVHADGFMVNNRRTTLDQFDAWLTGIEQRSGGPITHSVVVTCTDNSSHSDLIKVLDLCRKHQLARINLASM